MEFVFGLIGLILGFSFVYGISILTLGSSSELRKTINCEVTLTYMILMSLLTSCVISVTLFALNNTYWHINYLIVCG